jgi:hypothetical protein
MAQSLRPLGPGKFLRLLKTVEEHFSAAPLRAATVSPYSIFKEPAPASLRPAPERQGTPILAENKKKRK